VPALTWKASYGLLNARLGPQELSFADSAPWQFNIVGRKLETFADMSKSRSLGFLDCQPTDESFENVFAELRAARIIPN
jgi:hypothetical protein